MTSLKQTLAGGRISMHQSNKESNRGLLRGNKSFYPLIFNFKIEKIPSDAGPKKLTNFLTYNLKTSHPELLYL